LKKESDFIVGRIDCDVESNQPYCLKNEVTGFPTIKLFHNKKSSTFEGNDRSKQSIVKFATTTTPTKKISIGLEGGKWNDNSDVLDFHSFNLRTTSKNKIGEWIVAFYSESCPFCHQLIPVYEELATILKNQSINLVKLNVNSNTHGSIIRGFKISAVPTLKYIRNGSVYNLSYTGQGVSDFLEFVKNGWKKLEAQTFPSLPELPQKEQTKQIEQQIEQYDESEKEMIEDFETKGTFSFIIGNLKFLFSQNELLQGVFAAFLLFGLGFILGRVTAPSSNPKREQKSKTS